jgi:DNA-binding IclR family transcriptional regulator
MDYRIRAGRFPLRVSYPWVGATDMNEKSENVRAVERALDVLECIGAARQALSIGEIEKRVKLSRPTLYRIISTLIKRSFVRRDGNPPRYRLDTGAGHLADSWTKSLDIMPLATPLMKALLDRYDETIALYMRKNTERLCVSEMVSRQALSYSRGLGHSGILARGASGLAMLAFMKEDEADRLIAKQLDTSQARRVHRRLTEIREAGYAISSGDFIAGAHAIASPVFNRDGDVVGSLGLFGPSVRFPARRIAECAKAVKDSASELSSLLGHR